MNQGWPETKKAALSKNGWHHKIHRPGGAVLGKPFRIPLILKV
jgi:hypothetical protein